MKLRTAWQDAAASTQKQDAAASHQKQGALAADKSAGAADVNLAEHLRVTGQENLPQAALLQGCFDMLREKGLIEEAYLRGSLGRGHADVHSDIDLFAVVLPENVGTAYAAVSAFLEAKGGVVTDCHDRLVEDYGGIGFMFVANNAAAKTLYQFDFYMAIKGVAPATNFSIKPRIYTRDPDYCWLKEFGNPRDPDILPPQTENFIRSHTEGTGAEERLALLMKEQLLNAFVTAKHIKRGQTSRLLVDNKAAVSTAIEMMQVLSGYTSTGYSPVYLGNEVVQFCRENGDEALQNVAARTEKLFTTEMDLNKLRETVDVCKTILQGAAPEKYEEQKAAIALFEEKIFPAPKAQPKRHLKRGM